MEHNQIVKSIQFIKPNTEFSLLGTELTWLDKNQTEPTGAEIEAGWVAYQAAQAAEADNKAAQRQALLNRLNLTEDEARLLLA
jgi:hypothetical protein